MRASLVGGKCFGSGIFLFVNDLYLKLKEIIFFETIMILVMLKRTCHRTLCHIGIEAIKKWLFRMTMYWIYLALLILLQFFIEYNLQTYSSTNSVFCSNSVDSPNVLIPVRNLALNWRIERHFFLPMPMKQLVVSHWEIACKPGSASMTSTGKSWLDMSIIFKFGPVLISRSKSASIFCWQYIAKIPMSELMVTIRTFW